MAAHFPVKETLNYVQMVWDWGGVPGVPGGGSRGGAFALVSVSAREPAELLTISRVRLGARLACSFMPGVLAMAMHGNPLICTAGRSCRAP